MHETLRDALPPLYRPLLPSFFDRKAFVESRATCGDCAMCAKGDTAGGAEAGLDVAHFRPDIKCCSYHPTLPNYAVGAVFSDESPALDAGRARLRKKIAARIGVTPRWLAAPRKYLVLLSAARESSFGRSDVLLCPYFEPEGGTCSIWSHRESVCSTFFCKHDAGASGHAFWSSLRDYLEHVERTLARHAASTVAPELAEPPFSPQVLTREDLEDRPPSDEAYARYWGSWLGKEELFYVECAKRVRELTAEPFERLVGDERGRDLATRMEERYRDVAEPKLAPRLVLNPALRVVQAQGGVGVSTYSRYDSLFLTKDLYDGLLRFAGEDTVDVALERLRRDHDVELSRELLLELQVLGVLSPP